MRGAPGWLLIAGTLLLIGVVASQGLEPVFATLATAGWGLLLLALFHLLPLWLDAAAIRVLFDDGAGRGAWRHALLARWVGESANSLMPLGQVAGPVVMTRYLSARGVAPQSAAAAITVSTTLQAVGQFGFGLIGVALLALPARLGTVRPAHESSAVIAAVLSATAALAVILLSFYLVQRRGLFGGAVRALARIARRREWSELMSRADAIDLAIGNTYRREKRTAASFALSFAGWVVGSGEVYLALRLLGSPVGWLDAILLESLGQAIRGAAFAIPGALGVQEGGYLLLAPLAGLEPDAALALSFAKRTRELLLGIPGLLYLHRVERARRREREASRTDSGRALL